MAIRGIVFDLDGVLWDSTHCHRAAFASVLREFGVEGFDYARFAGWRTEDVLATVLRQAGRSFSDADLARAVERKRQLARQELERGSALMPQCVETLRQLSQRYRLGLASSASRRNVELFLRRSGLTDCFRTVLSGEDVQKAKPAPEIYLESFRRLSVEARECLVVEDAAAGVQAAKAAGATAVGLVGTSSHQELIDSGADAVLTGVAEVPSWLARREQSLPRDGLHLGNWEAYAAPKVLPMIWTAVIPAAGRGSRMGFDKPKILYPVAGRPILEWLMDLLLPFCQTVVLVLSPAGRAAVEERLSQRAPGRYRIAIQAEPTGMGDAVAVGLEAVETLHAAVVWGDQVALRSQSVEACLRLHQGWLAPRITCPTVWRDRPYIHFLRGPRGELRGVLQAREGDDLPDSGESDTGFFCFRTQDLRALLQTHRGAPQARGRRTGEFNLLPLIPLLAREDGAVLTPRLMAVEETVGVNSPEDAAAVEAFLRDRHVHG
ncbi:MAG: HAD-IA family hydrolase [Bryobacterales bacterium]|nr:HAD-IA family hydrolase [Bryobacteraceae bacterium]MDW8355767.1 HAD-IA family hydrolase [Bryobacterales bacterium]